MLRPGPAGLELERPSRLRQERRRGNRSRLERVCRRHPGAHRRTALRNSTSPAASAASTSGWRRSRPYAATAAATTAAGSATSTRSPARMSAAMASATERSSASGWQRQREQPMDQGPREPISSRRDIGSAVSRCRTGRRRRGGDWRGPRGRDRRQVEHRRLWRLDCGRRRPGLSAEADTKREVAGRARPGHRGCRSRGRRERVGEPNGQESSQASRLSRDPSPGIELRREIQPIPRPGERHIDEPPQFLFFALLFEGEAGARFGTRPPARRRRRAR